MMKRLLPLLLLLFTVHCSLLTASAASAAEKWSGVDETVVEKIAREHGREAKPLFEFEGDLLLSLFLGAGCIGGFAAGYWWRMLTENRREKKNE